MLTLGLYLCTPCVSCTACGLCWRLASATSCSEARCRRPQTRRTSSAWRRSRTWHTSCSCGWYVLGPGEQQGPPDVPAFNRANRCVGAAERGQQNRKTRRFGVLVLMVTSACQHAYGAQVKELAGRVAAMRERHLEQTTRLLALARYVAGLEGRFVSVTGRG